MPVDRLPAIPKVAGRCLDCNRPSFTAYCDACLPSREHPIGFAADAPTLRVDHRHNGTPVYRQPSH